MNIIFLIKKYFTIMTRKQVSHMIILFFLMVIAGFMEMCSVSLVLPFMDIVMKPEDTMKKWYVVRICESLGISSSSELLVDIALLLAALYLFKNSYILWEVYIQQRFVGNTMFTTQSLLLQSLLYRPYEDFMTLSSGKTLNIIGNLVPAVFILLTQLLNMYSELITSAMLIVALFIITPKISVIMGLGLSVVLLLISKIIKPALKKISQVASDARSNMNKWQLQSIQGVKELKIMGTERYFISNFNADGQRFAESQRRQAVWNNMPRAVIETSTMCGFLVMIAIHISRGNNIGNMFPVITAIAMAAVRLLPAANRISTSLGQVAYAEPYLDEIIDFINKGKNSGETRRSCGNGRLLFKDEIRLECVKYKYPNSDKNILEYASLSVKKGESVGIVGVSGSGKTTVVDLVLGLLSPQSGRVTVDGIDIKDDIEGWLSIIGYIPQTIFMLDDTIRCNVAFGVPSEQINDDEVWRVLKEAALDDFVRDLPQGLDSQIGERGMRLSGGQRQRIGIARALYRNPEVLFFDEATSALDNDTEEAIMESINGLRGQKTMIIIAHRLSTIESCNHIYRVEDGKIVKER